MATVIQIPTNVDQFSKPDRIACARAGLCLKDWRHRHRTSQRAFAKAAGLSVGTVQAFERGARAPQPAVVTKIARAMKLTTMQLLNPDTIGAATAMPGVDVTPDDLQMLRWYQLASGPLKTSIRNQLIAYHREAQQQLEKGPLSASVPLVDSFPERRSGIDRRQGHAAAASPGRHHKRA